MATVYIGTVTIDQLFVTGAPAPAFRWHVGPVKKKGEGMPIEVTLTTEEKVRLAVTPMTPGGHPAAIDGEAHWSVEGDCEIDPIDASSCWVLAGSDIGDSVVRVACDADLGQGVVPLADTCIVHVGHPQAAQLGLTAEAPVLKEEQP